MVEVVEELEEMVEVEVVVVVGGGGGVVGVGV